MRKSKDNKNNTTTTITPSASDKTPIEIALQIDSDGMTTASKLYSFLELNPSNFASWCRRNITRNKFATENEDYIVFVVENENPKLGGRPKTDYKLTSEFAKKLSMTGNTEKHEQARDYFIACEQGLKIATIKLQARNDDIQALAQSVNNLVQKIDNKFDSLESRVFTLENTASGCPKCNMSKGERRIEKFLDDNNIKYTPQMKYDDLKGKCNQRFSYDFYLHDYNILIEYQGQQHEYPVDRFGGEEKFARQQEIDAIKNMYSISHNIELMEIWYYDFDNIEEILTSRLSLKQSA